ncbi:MAG: AMP-binding protein [Streptosporangiales bacterium]|nr:AMP-binding protein [Streptosporangiales bacterium]
MVDYETARRTFRLDVPGRYNWTSAVLDRWARQEDKLAMLWVGPQGEERRLTFDHFARASNRFANVLRGLGVQPGQSLFVMLPRVVEWWEVILGSMRAGVVWAPGTTLLTPRDLEYRLNAAEVRVVVTDAAGAEKIDEIREACPAVRHLLCVDEGSRPGWIRYGEAMERAAGDPSTQPTHSDDAAMLFFTSGTTGYPKMVLHTHASYPIAHTITGRFWLDNGPSDLHWTISDTGWAQAAWTCLFAPWNMGAAVFIHDGRGPFDPGRTLEMLERYPITTFFAPPTAYRILVQEDLASCRFKALRHTLAAGEPLNPEVMTAWSGHTGLRIHDGYGLTETVLVTGMFRALPFRPGSMGRVAPGYDVSVVDEAGEELPIGEEGVLGIRIRPHSPVGLFQEYWKNPDATARSRAGDFYLTGDRVRMDDEGYLWFVGRDDDVIISAGYRIGPFEVESALVEHPAVVEAAAVGSPHPTRGQVVKAFVTLAEGWEPSQKLARELQQHVAGVTAPYKYPREVQFVADLPKTISGKIKRADLRQMEADGRRNDRREPR